VGRGNILGRLVFVILGLVVAAVFVMPCLVALVQWAAIALAVGLGSCLAAFLVTRFAIPRLQGDNLAQVVISLGVGALASIIVFLILF
jgi:hypothetical protein